MNTSDPGQRVPRACDVFVDMTGLALTDPDIRSYASSLANATARADIPHQISVALAASEASEDVAPGARCVGGQSSVRCLEEAFGRAAFLRRNLIILRGPLLPDAPVLHALMDALDRDPMFGTAQPRFAQHLTDRVWPLPHFPLGEAPAPSTRRSALALLPDHTLTAEFFSACVLLRWSVVVAAARLVDHDYATVAGALSQLLCQVRRMGFRNVVVNHAIVSSPLSLDAPYPDLVEADRARLRANYPDVAAAESETSSAAHRQLEPLLSVAQVARHRRRVLLDCRSTPTSLDITAQCVLGVLSGLTSLGFSEDFDVLVSPDAAKYHRFAERFDGLKLDETASGHYAAAVSLSSPLSLSAVAELHRHSLVSVFNMSGPIGWDVALPGNRKVGSVWRFLARHADGLVFNSDFTRQLFATRFPIDPSVATEITPSSLAREDYIEHEAESTPVSDYILVLGDEPDGERSRSTASVLKESFPFTPVVSTESTDRSPAAPCDSSAELDFHRQIAGARVIVSPTLYEPFGFSVVRGLAYGRPVIVCRSPLWSEIAGFSSLPGELVEFDDVPSLIERVGQALCGSPAGGLARGVLLSDVSTPVNWKDCAGRLSSFIDRCILGADGQRWLAREHLLRVAGFRDGN